MQNKEKRPDLGFFNALTLILIVFLPVFFALRHLNQNASDLLKKSELIERDTLEYEMNDFAESLVPATFVERAMESVEVKLGLRTNLKPEQGKDPGIYNRAVFEKMFFLLQKDYALKPVFMVGFEYDLQTHHSFYSKDFADRSLKEKSWLEKSIIGSVVVDIMRSNYWKNDIVRQRVNNFKIYEEGILEEKALVAGDALQSFFSRVAFMPKIPGNCQEIFTSKLGSEKLYFYFNGSVHKEHIYGGYFTVFAGRDIPCEKILSLAKKEGGIYRRDLVKNPNFSEQKFHKEKGTTTLSRHLPESFQIQLSQNSKSLSFTDLNKSCLRVSVSDYQINGTLKWYFALSSLAQKLFLWLTFAFTIHFYLFGFRINGRLRKKILLISGLIILLPYLLVGYFSGLILDSIDKIRLREVQTAAECKIYEMSRFVKDLYFRRQLVALKAKKRINDLLLANQEKLFVPDVAKKIIPPTLSNEIPVFLGDGRLRVLNRKKIHAAAPQKIARFMGYNYLSNLGVLCKKNKKVIRQLQLANLASGFLSGLSKGNKEGDLLAFESSCIRDFSKVEALSKITYFLFASCRAGLQQVSGLAFIFYADLCKFGDAFNLLSYEFQKFFNEKTELVNHDFAIGRRDSSGRMEIWWPESITAEKKEKRLLEYAAKKASSGSETRRNGDRIETLIWKYLPDAPHLFAGVTTSSPDLWINFMFRLLPFFGGAFSFLSLFLLADFLWELFARPVKAFIPALNRISEGQYHTRIQIEKTDELGILADSFNGMAEGLQQREKMRRFVSEKLMENVAESSIFENSRSQKVTLSVLMSDIRGFTNLSEKHSPEEIVSLLNDYFTEMEEAIKEFGGSVERFIGDAVVAVFYADSTNEHHATRAVGAAIRMRERLTVLNENRKQTGKFVVENGIGIVTDTAISGVTGGESGRQVFMIIGSIMPRASELEALTANAGGNKIAVCGKTAELASNYHFVPIGENSDAFSPGENHE